MRNNFTIGQNSKFYSNDLERYRALEQVEAEPEGHGIITTIWVGVAAFTGTYVMMILFL